MHAEQPRPLPGADRQHGQRALGPLLDRQVEGLPHEILVRDRDQHRPAGRHQVAGPPGQLQRLPGVLAEVMRGVDDDAVGTHARRDRPLGLRGDVSADLGHHVGIGGPVRPGPRREATRVRADEPEAVGGGDPRQRRVGAAPRVVEQIRAGPGDRLPHLRAPGIHADDHVGMLGTHGRHQARHAADLLRRAHVLPRAGPDPADVQDVGPVGDRAVRRRQRGAELVGGAVIEKGIRGPVDHGHDAKRSWRPLPAAQPQGPARGRGLGGHRARIGPPPAGGGGAGERSPPHSGRGNGSPGAPGAHEPDRVAWRVGQNR